VKIKIDSISMTLAADNRSQKVMKRHEIGNCRFSSGEAMLIGIKFNVVQNMITNNEFKQFREITENRNGSVVAHSDMVASFKLVLVQQQPLSMQQENIAGSGSS
jgi:hypothetical protein